MKICTIVFGLFFLFFSFAGQAQVDSGYVEVKNAVLYYRIWGTGKPLLFLNGGPGFASDGFEGYAELLAENRQVILFDQRSTGKSRLGKNAGKWVTMSAMLDDIERLRKHLHIESWDVCGFSFGGNYAMHYARKFGKRIDKLILLATQAPLLDYSDRFEKIEIPQPKDMTARELEIWEAYRIARQQENKSWEDIYRLSNALSARHYVYFSSNYSTAADWFMYKSNQAIVHPSTYQYLKGNRNLDARIRKLKKYHKPVLIVHGKNDFVKPANAVANHQLFPKAQLEIIDQCGHMILLDQREKFASLVIDFLDAPAEKSNAAEKKPSF